MAEKLDTKEAQAFWQDHSDVLGQICAGLDAKTISFPDTADKWWLKYFTNSFAEKSMCYSISESVYKNVDEFLEKSGWLLILQKATMGTQDLVYLGSLTASCDSMPVLYEGELHRMFVGHPDTILTSQLLGYGHPLMANMAKRVPAGGRINYLFERKWGRILDPISWLATKPPRDLAEKVSADMMQVAIWARRIMAVHLKYVMVGNELRALPGALGHDYITVHEQYAEALAATGYKTAAEPPHFEPPSMFMQQQVKQRPFSPLINALYAKMVREFNAAEQRGETKIESKTRLPEIRLAARARMAFVYKVPASRRGQEVTLPKMDTFKLEGVDLPATVAKIFANTLLSQLAEYATHPEENINSSGYFTRADVLLIKQFMSGHIMLGVLSSKLSEKAGVLGALGGVDTLLDLYEHLPSRLLIDRCFKYGLAFMEQLRTGAGELIGEMANLPALERYLHTAGAFTPSNMPTLTTFYGGL